MSKRMLHIVHTEASVGWGGQEIRILSEARGMIERGHRVTLLCPSHARIYEEAAKKGVPAIALPIGRKKVKGIMALRRWLVRNSVDVINTHSSTDTWLAALANITLKKAPPIVRTRHISAPVSKNVSTSWLYQRATAHIVTTGELLRKDLIERNGYRPEHITSVPTGIDNRRFMKGDKLQARGKCGLTQDAFIVGIVATLRSWKGHIYLLEAFAKLLDLPNLHLVIVGEGPYRGPIEEKIAELGLAQRITMPGNQDDVVPWLQSLDLFVLPSYANEGVPQAILQAMFCGIPVISTPVGSITEAVNDGVTGFIVPAKDSNALSHKMRQLITDARLRDEFGARAIQTAESRFAYQTMLDRMEHIFYDVTRPRS